MTSRRSTPLEDRLRNETIVDVIEERDAIILKLASGARVRLPLDATREPIIYEVREI